MKKQRRLVRHWIVHSAAHLILINDNPVFVRKKMIACNARGWRGIDALEIERVTCKRCLAIHKANKVGRSAIRGEKR